MFGHNTIKNFIDNNVSVGKLILLAETATYVLFLEHVLITDKAASGVAPISVDKNGTPTHTP